MDRFEVGCTVTDEHRVVLDSPEAYQRAVRSMEPGRYIASLVKEESKRSNAANRYLFGIVYREISEYTGQSKDDIHDEMCARFTTKVINYTNPATGEIVEMEVVGRTSGMKVREFHEFVEKVKLFAAEFFGLTFEDAPDEFYKERDRAIAREKGRAA